MDNRWSSFTTRRSRALNWPGVATNSVAVIFPRTLRAGEKIELHFVYGGEVISEAGAGLLYVGARGTWYPNRGLEMASFDLQFRYPTGLDPGRDRKAIGSSSELHLRRPEKR